MVDLNPDNQQEPPTYNLTIDAPIKTLAWVYICVGILTIIVTILALVVGTTFPKGG
jgi:hypothetical protein